jgi:hypothetical protein
MYLLRSIDEQEKKSECAGCNCTPLERQRFNLREKFIERASIRCAEAPRPTSLSKSFDCFECNLTFEAANHATERCGEPSHIVVQRYVLPADGGPGRHLPLYFLSGHGYQDRQDRQVFFLLTAVF